MASVIKTENGKKIVLLNPSEKGTRYARQLKHGCVAETGEKLSDTQKAWRTGYLEAQKDSAKAYCHKKGIKSKAKPRKKSKN